MRKLTKYAALGLDSDDVDTVKKMIGNKMEYSDFGSQFAIVVGGDGTILDENIKKFVYEELVLRVHPRDRLYSRQGAKKSLGYSADVYLKNLDKAIEDLTNGRYGTEKATLIDCSINSEPPIAALNDIGIEGERHSSNILFKTTVNGTDGYLEKLPSPRCTGVVVSGRYASTAWNLSLDGPIVLHKDAFVIDFREPPIKQAHWVAPIDDTILIELFSDCVVTIDRLEKHVPSGTEVEIKKSDITIDFIRTENTKESLVSKIKRYNRYHTESLQ